MAAMRVALISKTFVADTAQRQLEWIARQPGVELTLFTPHEWRSDDGRMLPFVPRFTAGYAYRTLPVLFNGNYHFYIYRGLRTALRALAPDLIHIDEEPYNPAGFQAQRSADRQGVPTVFVAWQNLFRAYPLPFQRIERYNYAHTAHIIAGNGGAGEVVRRKGYRGPLSTFSVHGVDPSVYGPLPRRRADNDPLIGYVGRLVLYKGTGLLIEALAGLPAMCRLRFVGSGPDEAQLRRLAAERGVADRVEFAPAVPATGVPEALAEMDVLALPSLTRPNWVEQFGRILIEAMACGVPVVGSDSGEIPNVLGDAGIVVPEGDVGALREALRELLARPDLRDDYAQRGSARVLARFTQEQVARRVMDVYQQATAGQLSLVGS
jgi:glycosyltransferase involved in cell wall biosynthesis